MFTKIHFLIFGNDQTLKWKDQIIKTRKRKILKLNSRFQLRRINGKKSHITSHQE